MNKNKMNRKGFTIIEVIIALFIFSVGVLGVLSMKTKAVANNGSSRQQSAASELCVSVLERLMMCDFRDDPDNPGTNIGDALIDSTNGAFKTVKNDVTDDDFRIGYSTAYNVRYSVTEVTPNLRLIQVSVEWPKHRGNNAMIMEYVIPRDSMDI